VGNQREEILLQGLGGYTELGEYLPRKAPYLQQGRDKVLIGFKIEQNGFSIRSLRTPVNGRQATVK
jgi:hypothetical protein